MRYLLRFFVVAPPVPPLMVTAFAATAAVAALVTVVDARRGAAAVTPVLVLQLFAASSGFFVPARRGHYDLLLTRGEGRLRVVLAHWLATVAPGAASWLVVGLAEVAVNGGPGSATFTSGTCAAMVLVSTLPWALSIGLPRFAPGIGWLVVLVMITTVAPPAAVEGWVRAAGSGPATVTAGAVFLLYPPAVLGRHLTPTDSLIVIPALLVAGVSMAAACRWIVRADVPLETAQ